ncbi:unnamed protein product [Acanthosepion pharaonis]|uniref:Uncharacterized protein n=1 Tax=Acanthosepion pharaonis TaxID=158019 RepID=A0A812DGM3_ACAPH|nr:unnamed protein product [Sepia pharaonis]
MYTSNSERAAHASQSYHCRHRTITVVTILSWLSLKLTRANLKRQQGAAVSSLTDFSHQFLITKQLPSGASSVRSYHATVSSLPINTKSGLSPDTTTSTDSVASINTLPFLEASGLVFCLVSVTPCFIPLWKAIFRMSVEGIPALLEAAATTSRTKLCLKVYKPFCSALEQDDSTWRRFPYAKHNRQEVKMHNHLFKFAGDAATSNAEL